MRSDAYVEVLCDNPKCDYFDSYEITAIAHGWDERNLSKELEDNGWILIGDREYCCVDCAFVAGTIVREE